MTSELPKLPDVDHDLTAEQTRSGELLAIFRSDQLDSVALLPKANEVTTERAREDIRQAFEGDPKPLMPASASVDLLQELCGDQELSRRVWSPTPSTDEGIVNPEDIKDHEIEAKPKLRIRSANLGDVEALVDVDIKSFNPVYKNYEKSHEELRTELLEKFRGRLEITGGDWCQVLESDGKMIGFLWACPTSKKPEEFESWEDTTDNGTLEKTYDPNGKYLYVVSLSVTNEKGHNRIGRQMLTANAIGRVMSEGYSQAYFVSRLPKLKKWMEPKTKKEGKNIEELTESEVDNLANEYFHLTRTRKGKEEPFDPELKMYAESGCKFLKLVPNGYQDEESMNYGVVTILESRLPESVGQFKVPEFVAKFKPFVKLAGWAMRAVSHSPTLTRKLP